MIRLVFFEFRKIWRSRRFLAALAALLALDFFLLWMMNDFDGGTVAAYRELADNLRPLSAEQKAAFIEQEAETARILATVDEVVTREEQTGMYDAETRARYAEYFTEPYLRLYYAVRRDPGYTGGLAENARFFLKIKKEADEVYAHPAFIDEMEQKAARLSGISIFADDAAGYDRLNIAASAEAYGRLRGVEIDYFPQAGLETALDFSVTDWLLLAAAMFLSLTVLTEEREKGLLRLTRSTPRGKRRTAAAKIAAVFLSLLAVVAVFYGGSLLVCGLSFGLGDLSRSIQSVPFLTHSVLRVSVGEYLLLFLAVKSGVLACVALVMLTVCLCFRQVWSSFLTVFALLGASFAVRALIPATGRWAAFKYANLLSALNTNELLGVYFNINILDKPCSRFAVEFIAVSLFAAATALLFVAVYPRLAARDAARAGGGILPLERVRCTSVRFTEGYKFLVQNGAALVLALFFVSQVCAGLSEEVYLSSDELRYRTYMLELGGRYDMEAYDWLRAKSEEFIPLHELEAKRARGEVTDDEYSLMAARYDDLVRDYAVFVRVLYGNVAYAAGTEGACLVYDTGYARLFDTGGVYSPRETLWCMIALTLCVSDIVAKEKKSGMLKLVKTTPLGRRYTFRCRMRLCAAAACFAAVCSVLARLIVVLRFYGLPGLFYPLRSLMQFGTAWRVFGIWTLALFAVLSRCAGAFAAVVIMSAVSCKAPNTVAALALNTGVFCVPLVLSELLDEQFRYLSAYPLFSAPEFLKTGGQVWIYLLLAAVLAGYAAAAGVTVKKEFA